MAKYNYEAMNSSGQDVSGEIEATDSQAAIAAIRIKGLFPTRIREVDPRGIGETTHSALKLVSSADHVATLREAIALGEQEKSLRAQADRLGREADSLRQRCHAILYDAEKAQSIKPGTVYIIDGKGVTPYRDDDDGKHRYSSPPPPLRIKISEVVQ
jgi:type II secretory pathway component PulF